jgi:hypothetical protein
MVLHDVSHVEPSNLKLDYEKKKKLPDPQYNSNQYPFGGAINTGVTNIAKALDFR